MQDKICEIPTDKWPELRDLFLPDWPRNIYAYNLLENYIRWLGKDPNIKNLKIYALNDDWSDGTFVVVDRYQLFLNTMDDNQVRLRKLMSLLDWSKGFQVHAVLKRYRPLIMEMVEKKNLAVELEFHTYMQYLPHDEAEHFDETPPEGITLQRMSTLEHAIQANKAWLYHDEGSLFFIRRLLEWNENMGAFNEKGELVAWCFRFQFGGLGLLHVTDKYKRKGLGSALVKAMAKRLALSGADCIASVVTHNTPSLNMFQKLGFREIDEVSWIHTVPLVPCKPWVD